MSDGFIRPMASAPDFRDREETGAVPKGVTIQYVLVPDAF